MAALTRVIDEFEGDPEGWCEAAGDDILGCRGEQHNFPKIRVRRGQLAKGVIVRRVKGQTRIESKCPDCGTVRWLVTSRAGVIEDDASAWRYRYPPGYKAPRGTRIPPRMARQETVRRVSEDIELFAQVSDAHLAARAEMIAAARAADGASAAAAR